ncbi:MAG: hypothetical protein KDC28_07390 [Saprospiraceae bacterium]|nr:hypothetical protein [Saprospiraceae bacterium]MCB9319091.1 hypothetical protein [Lewinellaceae bacterium]
MGYEHKEKLQLRHWLVYGVFGLFLIGWIYLLIETLSKGEQNRTFFIFWIIVFAILAGIVVYLHSLKLVVKIGEKGISYKYAPWTKHKTWISWDKIKSCHVIQSPTGRTWTGYHDEFHPTFFMNVDANKGILLETTDGTTYFLGIRNLQSVKDAISKYMKID